MRSALEHISLVRVLLVTSCVLLLAPRAGEQVGIIEPPEMRCDDCNLLLISIDTLRADGLGVYGAPAEASPHIDAFARQATVFERAYSASCVTADAHMSMFTGLYPSVHGVHNAEPVKREQVRLSDAVTTLPQQLAEHGFRANAIAAGGNMSGAYGFSRGMDSYEEIFELALARKRFSELLDGYRAGERFMLFFHTYRLHDPYMAEDRYIHQHDYEGAIEHRPDVLKQMRDEETFRSLRDTFWSGVDKHSDADRARLVALYEALIREVDQVIGEMLEELREKHPNTMVVIVSDHGEQFGEHGGFLHNDLFEELVRVPWIVSSPKQRYGHRVAAPVSTVDLAPTLLEWLGVPALEGVQGRSLEGIVRRDEPPRPIYAEKRGNGAALRLGSDKIIERYGRRLEYDLSVDPRERVKRHIGLDHPLEAMAAVNQEKRNAISAQTSEATHSMLDPELEAQLNALGYMD